MRLPAVRAELRLAKRLPDHQKICSNSNNSNNSNNGNNINNNNSNNKPEHNSSLYEGRLNVIAYRPSWLLHKKGFYQPSLFERTVFCFCFSSRSGYNSSLGAKRPVSLHANRRRANHRRWE